MQNVGIIRLVILIKMSFFGTVSINVDTCFSHCVTRVSCVKQMDKILQTVRVMERRKVSGAHG